jgi:hypothetical protein
VLVGARASQGVFGALLAPSALSLLTLTFHNSPERQKAFGIFTLTVLALVIGAVLLLAFTLIERRSGAPLVPPHVVRDRARVGAYAATALAGSGVFSLFLFLTFFIQNDLHFTPLLTGVSFLPFTAAVIFAATVNQARVLPRIGARPVVVTGAGLGIGAMLLLTRLSPHARRQCSRYRHRLGDGQHLPADRRLGRDRGAQQHVRRRGAATWPAIPREPGRSRRQASTVTPWRSPGSPASSRSDYW